MPHTTFEWKEVPIEVPPPAEWVLVRLGPAGLTLGGHVCFGPYESADRARLVQQELVGLGIKTQLALLGW